MKFPGLAVLVATVTVSLVATGCGSESTAELDPDEFTEVLVDAGLSADDAECAAQALIDAELTLSEVEQLAEDGKLDDDKQTEAVVQAIEACDLSTAS